MKEKKWKEVTDTVGNTPLVRLKNIPGNTTNTILVKLEGNNPAGSVKDRPAFSMISRAEERGEISPGDTLIEATSGNTGIALAAIAAMKGYNMVLIMPETATAERRAAMAAYGARVVLVRDGGGMEAAIDLARAMVARGEGKCLDQFSNPDNPRAHFETTGPEIWDGTSGAVDFFVSAMGTTGTITGVSRYMREVHPEAAVTIVGVRPEEGARIPGIRRWPQEYLPRIFDPSLVDREVDVSQAGAEDMARRLAEEEGIFAGVSSGGCVTAALKISEEVENKIIVAIVCDRGDKYLSTLYQFKQDGK